MSKKNIKLEMLKNKNLVLDAHLIQLTRKIEETNRNLIHVKGEFFLVIVKIWGWRTRVKKDTLTSKATASIGRVSKSFTNESWNLNLCYGTLTPRTLGLGANTIKYAKYSLIGLPKRFQR